MKKGIILTSFGTTYQKTLEKNIESLENLVEEKYGEEFLVLRAFTSRIVAKRLAERGYHVDNPSQALEKMKAEGIEEIYIQPSLIIEGHEYEKIGREVAGFLEKNPDFKIKIGLPLLSSDEDYLETIKSLDLDYPGEDEAIIFMGHGSNHYADIAYEKFENALRNSGYKNIYVGTVEGSIELEDVLEKLGEGVKKIELRPFMLVAGDHATNDMASGEEDSWKSILEAKGYEVDAKLVGLGEFEGIRNIFLEHLKDLM